MSFLDWKHHFERLFEIKKIDDMLEFGLGEGTKILLDNCKRVTSLEILVKGTSDEWYRKCLDDYRFYDTWFPSFKEVPSHNMTDDIKEYILDFLKDKHFDAAFVDPGVAFRPEIVNLLFGKVDIIAAHDTSQGMEFYNWKRLEHPKDYTVCQFTAGEGTTFWIKDKDLADRIGGEPTGWIATITS